MTVTSLRHRRAVAQREMDSIIDTRLAPQYAAAWRLMATDTRTWVMPIIESLMAKLVEQYGKERGRQVYYAMEAEGKGPFGVGGKHHDLHKQFAERNNVEPITTPNKKKPRPRPKTRPGPMKRRR